MIEVDDGVVSASRRRSLDCLPLLPLLSLRRLSDRPYPRDSSQMLNTSSFLLCLYFVTAGYLHDVTNASFLQDFPSWEYTTRRPTGVKTFSEERLERKETGLFGWSTALYPYLSRRGSRERLSTSTAWASSTTSSRPPASYLDPVFSKKPLCDQDESSRSEEYNKNVIYMPISIIRSTPKPFTRDSLGNRQKKHESKAQKRCKEFEQECIARKSPAKSPDLEMRITGGRMADPKKNTFMVLIGYGTKSDPQWLCGGSIVSERYVLTAAHCTEGGTLGKAKWVRVGELDLSTRKDDARPQDKDIVERIRHPEYKEPAVYNDIALLKLESDVTFNEWVSPICLHTSKSLPSGPVTVAGWGRLDFVSSTSPMLLEVEINIYNDSECVRLMGNTKDKMQLPRGIDTDTMICAGEIRGGKDACSGDSGGPLFYEENACMTTQVGVTSIGKDCGLPNTAGIYTNVYKYISWIESVVWPDDD